MKKKGMFNLCTTTVVVCALCTWMEIDPDTCCIAMTAAILGFVLGCAKGTLLKNYYDAIKIALINVRSQGNNHVNLENCATEAQQKYEDVPVHIQEVQGGFVEHEIPIVETTSFETSAVSTQSEAVGIMETTKETTKEIANNSLAEEVAPMEYVSSSYESYEDESYEGLNDDFSLNTENIHSLFENTVEPKVEPPLNFSINATLLSLEKLKETGMEEHKEIVEFDSIDSLLNHVL